LQIELEICAFQVVSLGLKKRYLNKKGIKMREVDGFPSVHVVNHPLVQHKLSVLRNICTPSYVFRDLVKELAVLIGYEATAHMRLTTREIATPFATIKDAPYLKDKKPIIVPILRSGLFMSEGLLKILPCAKIGHVGIHRDAKTKKPVEYFVKVPEFEGQEVFLVDPMFATGGTAVDAVKALVKRGVPVESIVFMALLGSMEAVKTFTSAFPSIPLYIASVDEKLSDDKFLIPGLGDAGDRLFGTE